MFVCRRCARAGESVLKGMRPLEQETLRSEAIPRLLLSVTAVPQALAGHLGGVVKVRAQGPVDTQSTESDLRVC